MVGINEAINQFQRAMRDAGIDPPEHIEPDGEIHRFGTNGKRGDDAGWYVLYLDGIPAGSFGDWRTGLSQSWSADIGRKLTPEEERQQRRRQKTMQEHRKAEEERRHASARKRAQAIWKEAHHPAPADNPYLARKGVKPTKTLGEISVEQLTDLLGYAPKSRGEPLVGRILIAPVKVGDPVSSRQISTLEMIDGDGRKTALYGGQKKSGYWAAEPLPDGDGDGITLLIGEGVATVLSAREATGHPVIAALSSGNLPTVAKEIRARYNAAKLVILADLVKTTGEPDPHSIKAARDVGGFLAVPDFGEDRPAEATDFNDLHQARGLETAQSAINGASTVANVATVTVATWPEPQPLTTKVDPLPYPVDALPKVIRAAVEEVLAFTKAPAPLIVSSALAALSVACQGYIDVARAERLEGPVGLFLLTIADSGERKSTGDRFFTSAIREYQDQQTEILKPEIERYEAELDAWKAEREGLLSEIKAKTKKGNSIEELRRRLADLQSAKPEPPPVPRLLLGDETPENLAWCLAKQWPSSGVISSEAGVVLGAHGMNKDSVLRNLALLNILWDGGELSVGRKTSESFTVDGARLTVGLQIQEPALRSFFEKTGELARGTGFLARFLVAWPESTQGYRPFTEAPPNWPHLAAFHRRIAEILAVPIPMDEEGRLSPERLTLAPKTRAAWIEYHDAIESELRNGGELYDVRDVASKSADNAARLAALFHFFERGIGPVGSEAFEGASRIAAWHLNEARRFLGELALPSELADAVQVDKWLVDYCRQERTHMVSTRDAQRLGPVRQKDRLDPALIDLSEHDRVRVDQEGKKRIIKVNPALLENDHGSR